MRLIAKIMFLVYMLMMRVRATSRTNVMIGLDASIIHDLEH